MQKGEEKGLGFIGFGNMAEILYKTMEKSKLVKSSQVLFLRKNKQKQKETSQKYRISAASLQSLVERSTFIFFCVRPKDLEEVLQGIPQGDYGSKLFISIVSGAPLSYFQKKLGKVSLLRVMPNVASEVAEGMNLFCFSEGIDSFLKGDIKKLFGALGEIEEVPEDAIEILTAVSGSGPAYVLRLIQAFAKKGIEAGISKEKALKIAAQTFKGASTLLLQKKNLEELVEAIAVKGGTTEEGLKVFQEKGVEKEVLSVLEACIRKAKAFHSQFS